MWGPIIQILTLFGGGVALGTILEDDPAQIIIQQQPPIQAVPTHVDASATGGISPILVIAIAILVLATGYVIRAFRNSDRPD